MLNFLSKKPFTYDPITIFSIIGSILIALFTLYFIHSFGVNVPLQDEWDFIPFAEIVLNGGPFWEYPHFWQHNDHRPIFPSLIIYFSILLTSWNFLFLMYFGWVLVALSVLIIFSILKETFPKLIWLILPISAIMFNIAQYENFLWAFTSVEWFLVSSSLTFSVYFLNKIKNNNLMIIPASIFGIIATFSGIAGLLIWFLGIFTVFSLSRNKKPFISIWILISTLIFIIYFYDFIPTSSFEGNNFEFLSIAGIVYFLSYLSNGLILKFEILKISIGFILFVGILTPVLFFIKKNNIYYNFIPWFQLGLAGFFSAGFATFGRFSDTGYIPARYITQSIFDQISALVILTVTIFLIYENLHNKNYKKILKIIFIMLFLFMAISLSSSYYIGWIKGSELHDQTLSFQQCLQNKIFEFKCPSPDNWALPNLVYSHAKILEKLNLEPFHDKPIETIPDHLLDNVSWNVMGSTTKVIGEIEIIKTDTRVKSLSSLPENIFIKQYGLLQIAGWADLMEDNVENTSVYVFIDDEVHSKAYHGILRKDLSDYGLGTRSFSGWSGIIDLNELTFGCHDVSIRILNDNLYAEILHDKKICIEDINLIGDKQ
jgi:hypothetical protein